MRNSYKKGDFLKGVSNFFNSIKNSFFHLITVISKNKIEGNAIIYYIVFVVFFLLVSPLIIYFCLNETSDKSTKEYLIEENVIIKNPISINVYSSKEGKNKKIDLEEYVYGVVSAEMPANFEIEALKSQAVAARTYALSKKVNKCANSKGADICDTVHCQVYMNKEERFKGWGNKAKNYWDKIVQAVDYTKGVVLTYNNELVLNPQFFAISSGKTEDNKDVFASNIPYLKSVDSPGEEIAPKFKSVVKFSYNDFVNKINSTYKKAKMKNSDVKSQVKIVSRTDGGGVEKVHLGKISISGVEFRKLFNLNSSNFSIKFNSNDIEILCKGYGHGVGMSQWGANVMAKNGEKFDNILTHYYTGVKLVNINKK